MFLQYDRYRCPRAARRVPNDQIQLALYGYQRRPLTDDLPSRSLALRFDQIRGLEIQTQIAGTFFEKRVDLPRAASLVMELAYYNPRPVTYDGLVALLDDAFAGRCPRVASPETSTGVSGIFSR